MHSAHTATPHLGIRLQRACGVALAPAHLNEGGAQAAVNLAFGCHRILPHLHAMGQWQGGWCQRLHRVRAASAQRCCETVNK